MHTAKVKKYTSFKVPVCQLSRAEFKAKIVATPLILERLAGNAVT
jgi:hypothetical protein